MIWGIAKIVYQCIYLQSTRHRNQLNDSKEVECYDLDSLYKVVDSTIICFDTLANTRQGF